MTTERIIDRIQKLKAHQESAAKLGSVAEAEAFAEMINRLLLKHELTEVDLNVARQEDDPIVNVYTRPEAYGQKHVMERVAWQEALASIVAHAHLCKFLVIKGSSKLVFVGTRVNAETAEYAFGVLAGAADRMSHKDRNRWVNEQRKKGQYTGSTRGFRDSWLTAFVTRIKERFDEARRKTVEETGNASTALIRLDQTLARVTEYIDERYKSKARGLNLNTGSNSEGFRRGREAADSMAIGQRGIKDGKSSVKGHLS